MDPTWNLPQEGPYQQNAHKHKHKERQSSQARTTSHHTFWASYRVAVMLLTCFMTRVNNHPHYLAFAEKTVGSLAAAASL